MTPGLRTVRAAHEHEFEAAPGLPEALPAGESILWQGSPAWRVLAAEAFHVRAITGYFAVLLMLRAGFTWSDTGSLADTARAVAWLLPLFAFAVAMLLGMAWLAARTSVYTLTNRRVVLRVGIVLTLTFNLPLQRLAGAGLRVDPRTGHGDIPLQLAGNDKIAYVHLWPHARPWRGARPEPMLRSIENAAAVAGLLGQAWAAATGQPSQRPARTIPSPSPAQHAEPVGAQPA